MLLCDDPACGEAIDRALARDGRFSRLELARLADLAAACRRLGERPADLVLAVLPWQGLGAAALLVALPPSRHFPLVLLAPPGEALAAAAAAGAFDYEPWSPACLDNLPHRVERWLKAWELRAERDAMAERLRLAEAQFRHTLDQTLSHNLSEREATQVELEEARGFLESIVENLPAMVFVKDADELRFVRFNRAGEELLGLSREELLGKSDADFFPPAEADFFRAKDRSVLAGGGVLDIPEEPIHSRSLGERWLHTRKIPLRGADGKARFLLGISLDITERKRAEAALQTALREQRALLASYPAGVFTVSEDRRVMVANEAMEAMFGYGPGEMAGLPTREICASEETWRWIGTEGYEAIAGDGKLRTEIEYRRRDGSHFWGLLTGVLVDPQVPAKGRLFAVVDITDRLRLEEELRQADRKKDEFIATLAHELRNPLAPIRNAVAVLRKRAPADPQLTWCCEVIERQVGQMGHLLEDLLDVSRFSRGRLTLRRERLELSTVINQSIEIARPLVQERRHRLIVSLPGEAIWLEGDATRLAQVFSNLLTNAAKYSEEAGRIELVARLEAGEVEVAVKDAGIGIAAEQLPRVFEMFAQLDAAHERSQGGLGLGLSLVRALVELHGGSVEARSEGVGRGSEFIVRLPRSEPPAPPAASPAPAGGGPAAAWRILVVDDNRDVAETLALVFEIDGHEVYRGYGGEEAVRIAAEMRPELVLLDLGMPEVNGFEACRRIRAEPWGRAMRLVALTGWGQEEDRRRTAEAGFDAHLVKPVDPAALSDLLGRLDRP